MTVGFRATPAPGYRPRVSRSRIALVGAAAALALAGCGGAVTRDLAPAPKPETSTPGTPAPGTPAPTGSAPTDSATPDPSTPSPTTPSPTSPAATAPTTASPTTPTTAAARTPGILATGLRAPTLVASVRAGTFALGDSFLLGSKKTLTKAHVRVDAAVSRQFYACIPVLRAVVRSGTLPRNLVVHLGTNGTVTSKHCDNVVATAGTHRRVFLVTVIGPRSWMAPNVKVLKACAARHRSQVVVVDWAAVAASHPNWFGPDRVHPNPTGRARYNALILEALREYAV